MTTKIKIIICLAVVLTAFAVGRYTAPVTVKTEIKTVEVDKSDKTTDNEVNKHKHVIIKKRELPDGTKEETIIEDNRQDSSSKTENKEDHSSTTDKKSEIVRDTSSSLRFNILAGYKVPNFVSPIIGGEISKPFIGPITLGVWGLSDMTFGISVGLQF